MDDLDKYNEIGFSYLFGNNGAVGISLCVKEGRAYIINFMCISVEVVTLRLLSLCKKGVKLICLDVKEQLSVIGLNEEDSVFDCGVGAYLLNPMNEKYDYDDIAATFLNMEIPSRKELVGKKDINGFVFMDEDIKRHAPKQEKWIFKHKENMPGVKLWMALGATIDFEAGKIKRAPKFLQKLGLEWFYRFCNEPRRLFYRYFVDDIKFFALFAKQLLGSRYFTFHHQVKRVRRASSTLEISTMRMV